MDQDFNQLLEKHRLSNTNARKSVFAIFIKNQKPLSMRDLIAACKDIDRVTVYRIVDVFEKIGVLQRIQQGWKYKLELGDTFKKHHHHITCISCGAQEEFDEPEWLDNEVAAISKKHQFSIQQHSFELRGLCRNCRK
jgi:Fur family transcriptional regulator, ferric uptake regulator